MRNVTISFIGAGHMATSLIGGLISDSYDPSKIWASDPNIESKPELQKLGIHLTSDNIKAAQHGKILILSVKPQVLKAVVTEIAPVIRDTQPLVISIAAGVREPDICSWIGGNPAIIRCMPNTPALIQCGATALYANAAVQVEQKNLAEMILRAVGTTLWVTNEAHLDIVTALSGSGPAYFFLFMEAMEQTAVELGLPQDSAHLLTLQTALGAARMALESPDAIGELRKRVTSPGGTTERALEVLYRGNFVTLIGDAIRAASQRAHELGKILGA